MSAQVLPQINHYEILGIARNANPQDIKVAYRKAAKRHHPDKNPLGESMFKKVSHAYEVLSSDKDRKKHDHELAMASMKRRQGDGRRAGAGGVGGGYDPSWFKHFGQHAKPPTDPNPRYNRHHHDRPRTEKEERLYQEMRRRQKEREELEKKHRDEFAQQGMNFRQWYERKFSEAEELGKQWEQQRARTHATAEENIRGASRTPRTNHREPSPGARARMEKEAQAVWQEELRRKEAELAEMKRREAEQRRRERERQERAQAAQQAAARDAEQAMEEVRRQREELRAKKKAAAAAASPEQASPVKDVHAQRQRMDAARREKEEAERRVQELRERHESEQRERARSKQMQDAMAEAEEEAHRRRLAEISDQQRARQKELKDITNQQREALQEKIRQDEKKYKEDVKRNKARHEAYLEVMRQRADEKERKMLAALEAVREAKRKGEPIEGIRMTPLTDVFEDPVSPSEFPELFNSPTVAGNLRPKRGDAAKKTTPVASSVGSLPPL